MDSRKLDKLFRQVQKKAEKPKTRGERPSYDSTLEATKKVGGRHKVEESAEQEAKEIFKEMKKREF